MPLADLPKAYDPQAAQSRWYAYWLDKGYFHADPSSEKPPYTIVIPPPNVTGALHLGHALNNTLQDILIRWRRMQGYEALWMPGTDHAGIATQAVVERRLLEEEKKTRHDLGREALVERIWAWKDEYEKRILSQLRLMGCSCDWERTRFTLDPICARAVRETFFNLFKADKIFRGKRLVNWDTQLRTAVADDEIYYEDVQGHLWTIKYPVVGSDEALHVATTRPETMLGDTAVAVHPDDPRYKHLIGKRLELPLTGRTIPVIGDAILVDPKFGTGCVKVTPAHDPNDYQTGLRHNLPMINLLNPDGTFNENAGAYAGLDRRVVRKRVVADLEMEGLLVKAEPYATRVNYSDRSKSPIEPYLSDQWFVRMGDDPDGKPGLAQIAMDAVTSDRVTIHPERYAKSYLDWLGEKRDWCISRQLWWGHRIPVWRLEIGGFRLSQEEASLPVGQGYEPARERYLRDDFPIGVQALRDFLTTAGVGDLTSIRTEDEVGPIKLYISSLNEEADIVLRDLTAYFSSLVWETGLTELIEKYPSASGFAHIARKALRQPLQEDTDVLDTWFSSALWPHSTLGWPEPTAEMAKFYPTSVLSTARDIITLWVARMVIFGEFNTGDVPFRDVFIHPVIQDGKGQRMSKSAGNGIDPVDIIDLYGADALRFTLASSATETQDLRMPVDKAKLADGREVNTSERFEQGRTFPNKFWNAARFALMNLEGYEPGQVDPASLPVEDRWILSLLAKTASQATRDFESFAFADAARRLRDFTWNDFCDWYVEFAKGRLRDPSTRPDAQRVLAAALDGLCRLLHPIVPFVTESVWQALNEVAPVRGLSEPSTAVESVCIAAWPGYPESWRDEEAEYNVSHWKDVVLILRNTRADNNIPKSAPLYVVVETSKEREGRMQLGESHIRNLGNAADLGFGEIKDGLQPPYEYLRSGHRPDSWFLSSEYFGKIAIGWDGSKNVEAEREKHQKTLSGIEKQLASIRAKLGNEGFVSRAKPEVVAQQRAKEAELSAQREAVLKLLGEG